MSPSPKVLVKDEEEGLVKAAGVKDEQPEHRTYKWLVEAKPHLQRLHPRLRMK